MLKQHLLALANPKRHDENDLMDADGHWRSMPERLGAAFTEYVERYPADHTPGSGGGSATVATPPKPTVTFHRRTQGRCDAHG